MTGFDLGAIGGFDPKQFTEILQAMNTKPGQVQDPQRAERRPAALTRSERPDTPGFSGVLADAIDKVQGLRDDVRDKERGLALGEGVNLHDVMIAADKSEVAFNLVLEVRNKLVDAWDKLSRAVV